MAKENFPYQLFIVGEGYSRNDINQRLVNSQVSQQSGVSSFSDSLVLFATLKKEGRPEEIQYKDFFKCKNEFIERKKSKENNDLSLENYFPLIKKEEYNFFWESQNPTGNYGTPQKPLLSKFLKGDLKGYLFARIEEKTKSKSNPFLYCGSVEPESYDDKANGERPFGVKFYCNDIKEKHIKNDLKILLEWRPKDLSSIKKAEELASSCLANEKVKLKKIEEEVLWDGMQTNNPLIGIDRLVKRFNKYSLEPKPNIFTKLVEKNIFNPHGILQKEIIYSHTFLPEKIENFIIDFLKDSSIKSVLDPWMRNGGILYRVSKEFKTKDCYGYEVSKPLYELATVFNKNSKLYNEYFPNKKNFNKKFDLIISYPPMMMSLPSVNKEIIINEKKLAFSHHKETEIIFSSLKNLSDNGMALFIVSPGFLLKKNNRNIFKFIQEIGFSLEGIFHIPAGTFKPFSAIETRLIVLKKQKQSQYIFEGMVSFNKQRDQKLIENFKKSIPDHDPELGFLRSIDNGVDLKTYAFFEKMSLSFKDSNLEVRNLNQISEDIFIASEETIYRENSIFIFLNGNNSIYGLPVDIDNKFMRGLKNKSIAQVVINPEKINKKVLVKVLQSPRGKLAFTAFNSLFANPGRTRISLNSIKGLLICIPDKKKQDKLEELNQKLLDLKYQLGKFETSLWDKIDQPSALTNSLNKIINQKNQKNNPEELDIRLLPFPLASILQTVSSFNGIPIKMALHIEYFFEALSQFLTIYIMSGLYSDEEEFKIIWAEISNFLKEKNQTLNLSTFGTWNIIFNKLIKRIDKDISDDPNMKDVWLNRLAIENEEFFDVLKGKKIFGILMKANRLRNLWKGHTGAIGDKHAKERYNTYNEMVKEVLSLFGNFWASSPLIIPGESTYKDGQFNYYCQVAMGVTIPLPRKEYKLKEPLEDGMMHIISTLNGRSCKLLPLIKFGESPNNDNNACYFFNRRDDQSQRWISYHYENQPVKPFNDPEVNTLLDKLSND